MLWGIFISLLFLVAFALLIRKSRYFHFPKIGRKWIYLALLLKLCAAGASYLLYTQYYQDRSTADMFKYYDDAEVIYAESDGDLWVLPKLFGLATHRSDEAKNILASTSHWDKADHLLPNDNRLMISLNLLLLPISQGFYLFHLLFFCCLSFVGCIGLLHFFISLSRAEPVLLWAIIILPPSFLFWTSSLLKESVFLGFFGSMLYFLSRLMDKFHFRTFILWMMSILILIPIKTYLLICFLPAMLIYFLRKRFSLPLSLSLALLPILIILSFYWEQLNSEIHGVLQAFNELALASNAGSYFTLELPRGELGLIAYIPEAFYNVWARATMNMDQGLLLTISGLENLLYLALIPLALIFPQKQPSDNSWLIFWISFTFILLTTVLIGSSIPVLGALFRYRSPILPFYLLLLITFIDLKAIYKRIYPL